MNASTHTLSEYESKRLLAEYGISVPDQRLASSLDEAVAAADQLGYPVAAKLCGQGIAHKTERGLVRLGLNTAEAVSMAADELFAARRAGEESAAVLVEPMARGNRELIAGLLRDPQFGPCVMFGLGGILAEAVKDVSFAVAPLDATDAEELVDSLGTSDLLGPFRGEPAIDHGALVAILRGLGEIGASRSDVASIDINPLIVCEGQPIVVDALVEIRETSP